MSERIERRLSSLRRVVPEHAVAEYDGLWGELAAIVRGSGGHAWRFSATRDPSLRLEFLEYEATRDPRKDDGVKALLSSLEECCGPAAVEEWLEDR